MLAAPEKDAAKRMQQEMRVEELTAVLSGLTGGWFGGSARPEGTVTSRRAR